MADGAFRKKNGFTIVQNTIARDERISMKAKGLYLIIQSYITMPDREWKKDDFTKMVSEGKGSFDSAWKELKDAGYLKVYITSYGKGTKREYELLDEPKDGPSEIYIKKESMDESPESIENTEFVQLPENQVPGNQEPGNQVPGNQESGNQAPGNQVPENQVPGNQVPENQVPGNQEPGFHVPGNTDARNNSNTIKTKIINTNTDFNKPRAAITKEPACGRRNKRTSDQRVKQQYDFDALRKMIEEA